MPLCESGNRPVQNRLLHMQPVFGLGENRVGVGFKSFLVNFLAAICRQAVHHQRVRFGELHELLIDLITAQSLESLGGLGLLAHRNPHSV